MTVITLEHINLTFDAQDGLIEALKDIHLRILEGERLALLGPSGCGKTSLLRIVAGLLEPTSGRVLYDNVPSREIAMEDRGIGMVFQDGALMPHWDGRTIIGLFLELRKREDELDERLKEIAQITGLGMKKLLTHRPNALSMGERQRVGIARALARDLQILLLDEPFSSLDAQLRSQARLELQRLLQQFPVTTIYVTHDQVEAMAIANRIVVMREGRIEQTGAYQHLYETPANLFVARFIGVHGLNCLKGEITEDGWQGYGFGPFPIRRDLGTGTAVLLGIRPEHIHPATRGDPGTVTGRIQEITPFFSDRRTMLRVARGIDEWTMFVPLDHGLRPGEILPCRIDPAGILYFDAENGQRIG